jgi:hypothetical protein
MPFAIPSRADPDSGNPAERIAPMLPLEMMFPLAAAGWAFLVWLCGGGLGLAILVFIVLKIIGH